MDKELFDRLLHYNTALAVARQWVAQGIISEDDYEKCRTVLAEKYGISSHSIFR